jgi:hypothetical protein
MTAVDRRRWLGGASALLIAPSVAKAAGTQRMYDYLFLDLDESAGTPPARAFADQVRARTGEIASRGGEVLGLFTPQLGWSSRQAALLLSWRSDAPDRESAIAALRTAPGVRSAQRHKSEATARPAASDRPQPGGIYVHRWFVVETAAVPQFVELSVQGWRDFEARFDTHIFGLFATERADQDRKDGVTRLLLITRYRDHGVWEASRDPSTEAMAAFARRQRLTRDSWAASTLLFPIAS